MTQKWQVQVYKYSLFSVFELNLTRSLSIAIYIVREFNFTLIQRTQRKSAALDLRSQKELDNYDYEYNTIDSTFYLDDMYAYYNNTPLAS